jgi:hypothetical protein
MSLKIIIFSKNTNEYYGCQTYRFDLYNTDFEVFVQLTDRLSICTLKCTDFKFSDQFFSWILFFEKTLTCESKSLQITLVNILIIDKQNNLILYFYCFILKALYAILNEKFNSLFTIMMKYECKTIYSGHLSRNIPSIRTFLNMLFILWFFDQKIYNLIIFVQMKLLRNLVTVKNIRVEIR